MEIGTSESRLSSCCNATGMCVLSQTSLTRVALVFDIARQNSSGEDLLKAAKSASRHSSKRKLSVRVQKTACRDRDEVVTLRQSAGGGHLLRSYLCCDWVVFEGVEKCVGGHVFFGRKADVLQWKAMSCLACCRWQVWSTCDVKSWRRRRRHVRRLHRGGREQDRVEVGLGGEL